MQEQRTHRPKRVDEVLADAGGKQIRSTTASGCKPAADALTEDAGDVLGGTVSVHRLHRAPLHGLVVRLPFAATDRYDLMPGVDQPGHQVLPMCPVAPITTTRATPAGYSATF